MVGWGGRYEDLEGMGIKRSAQSSKTELNTPQRTEADAAISYTRGATVETIHALSVEILLFCAAWVSGNWTKFLYNAGSLFCDPGGFLSAN